PRSDPCARAPDYFHVIRTCSLSLSSFFFTDPATSAIYTLSLHDALPICLYTVHVVTCKEFFVHYVQRNVAVTFIVRGCNFHNVRSEEHTSELQSRFDLVCRLLLEKKKKEDKRQMQEEQAYSLLRQTQTTN